MVAPRKSYLLRLDPAVHAAIEQWARDDLRSVNAQIEWLLADALRRAGRAPKGRRRTDPGDRGHPGSLA
jgi:hypothetical protein